MGTNDWKSINPLENKLLTKGHTFDFYRAVYLLEHMHKNRHSLGTTPEPEKEAIQIKSAIRLDFPATDIHEIIRKVDNASARYQMSVNFMGLAGATGPLPLPYTELILDRVKKNDTAFRDFLDIFNHRILSLLYKAAKIFRPFLSSESPVKTNLARYLFSIAGIDPVNLQHLTHIDKRLVLAYASIFAQPSKNIFNLEQLLSNFFNIKVSIKQFCGNWVNLSEDQLTSLGYPFAKNNKLGHDSVLGDKAFSRQNKIEIVIGPLSFDNYCKFLPSGQSFTKLKNIAQYYLGELIVFDVTLLISTGDISQMCFGNKSSMKLGYTTWLVSEMHFCKTLSVRI